jgi:hypothetical protein
MFPTDLPRQGHSLQSDRQEDEMPVRGILMGVPVEKAANRFATAIPSRSTTSSSTRARSEATYWPEAVTPGSARLAPECLELAHVAETRVNNAAFSVSDRRASASPIITGTSCPDR